MRHASALVMAIGVLWPSHAAAFSQDQITDRAIERCRQAFPDVMQHPGRAGGLFIEQTGFGRLLCIYGSLENLSAAAVEVYLASETFDVAVARSMGGPVDAWLGVAEHLVGKISTGVVDEACFSSCANYFVVLPQTLLATKNSLVVWHGGPADMELEMFLTEGVTISDLIGYQDIAHRTKALYEMLDISTDLLNLTAEPPTPEKLAELAIPQLHENVAGYAVSPKRLSSCFNVIAAENMWHAGNDIDVAALAYQRSPKLGVLEWPFLEYDETPKCVPKK